MIGQTKLVTEFSAQKIDLRGARRDCKDICLTDASGNTENTQSANNPQRARARRRLRLSMMFSTWLFHCHHTELHDAKPRPRALVASG
jgi:hypothetical protein